MKLALYPTGHGYGHLTRLAAIARQVQLSHSEWELHLRAPFAPERVRALFDIPPASIEQVRLDTGLVQHDSLTHDPAASVAALERDFGPEGDERVHREAQWLAGSRVDAALVDISPRAFDACRLAEVPAYGVSNFSWDDIWRDLARREEPAFFRFANLAAQAYGSCRLLFRLPMHMGMESFPAVEDTPLVARVSRQHPRRLRTLLGLDHDRIAVLLAFGGAGMGPLKLPGGEALRRIQVVATPPMKPFDPALRYITEEELGRLDLHYHDLVRAVDVAIIKPGYSTVAECLVNRTGIVITPRPQFPEGEVIERFVLQQAPSVRLEREDLREGRWLGAVEKAHRELRTAAHWPFEEAEGAAFVVRRLAEEIRSL